MSDAVPRERLSAWQRWEMGSIGVPVNPRGEQPAEALLRETEAARAAGHSEGIAQGRAEGYAAGVAAAGEDVARLRDLLERLATSVAGHEQRMADEVLDLALVFARQMVGEALAIKREFVLPVVTAALKHLPQSTQRIELKLNPEDLDLVRSLIATDPLGPRVALIADSAQVPGGCSIETEQTAVDATVVTRWRRLLASLGRDDAWLDPL